MELIIDKKIFPLEKDIKINVDGSLTKIKSDINSNIPKFGTQDFKELCKIYYKNLPIFPSREIRKPFEQIFKNITDLEIAKCSRKFMDNDNYPWIMCLPKHDLKSETNLLISKLREDFSCLDISYWDFYKSSKKIFDNLYPAKIDLNLLESIENKKQVENSFLQNADKNTGFVKPPTYSRLETITGRMIVENGPQILLLRKSIREKLFVSRFGKEGSIYYLDFSSIDPRTLIAIQNKISGKDFSEIIESKDVYLAIQNNCSGLKNFSRDQIKNVIIAQIYGASFEALKHKNITFDEFLFLSKEVRVFFDLENFEKNIENFEKDGFLYNWYGKPILVKDVPEHKRKNYLVQSTANDIACLGFSILISQIENLIKSEKAFPIYVLHDALLIDAKNICVDELNVACEYVSNNIPKFSGMKFPININKLGI